VGRARGAKAGGQRGLKERAADAVASIKSRVASKRSVRTAAAAPAKKSRNS